MSKVKVVREYEAFIPDTVPEMIEILKTQEDFDSWDVDLDSKSPFEVTDIFVDFIVRQLDVGEWERTPGRPQSGPDDLGGAEVDQKWEVIA